MEEESNQANKSYLHGLSSDDEYAETDDFNIDFDMDGVDNETIADTKSSYQLVIVLNCEKETAESIEEVVNKALKKQTEVESITLRVQRA